MLEETSDAFLRINMKKFLKSFTRVEIGIWVSSVTIILSSFFIFDREGYLNLITSLIGVTSLIICAKGLPLGQALMLVFAVLYGTISLGFGYYGEMITYLGMSAPMALFALISWIRNPYEKGKGEVKIRELKRRDIIVTALLATAVTVSFYFILKALNTANLITSTISVATSFFAAYLMFLRSPYFALAYAANDVVLIVLWVLAAIEDYSYVSVIPCFVAFLLNDLYGFFNWTKMKKRQSNETKTV